MTLMIHHCEVNVTDDLAGFSVWQASIEV